MGPIRPFALLHAVEPRYALLPDVPVYQFSVEPWVLRFEVAVVPIGSPPFTSVQKVSSSGPVMC